VLIERTLRQLPFFSQLSTEQVQELVRLGRIVSMPAGRIVCHEGESSDSMFVLLAGKVSVYRHDTTGTQVEVRQFEAGDYFGEVAFLDSKARTATAACVTECELFVLDQAVFRRLLAANPSLVLSVLRALADRSREQIEERYQTELANLALEAQAELDRHRSLSQMVAGVAHELNTPLGVTNTAVEMVANRLKRPGVAALFEGSDQSRQLLDNLLEATTLAQRNIARAHRLIQDFKKVSVSQLVDTPQAEDLAQLVASSVDLLTLSNRRAKLDVEIDSQLPPDQAVWFGYPGHLTQVLTNLLTNIERYAYDPATGGPVEITLSAGPTRQVPTFTITVRDHGRGIPAENVPKVFEPFFTTGRNEGGSGLGLAIVRNIVTAALEGDISLDSAPGRGTTFTITLPQEVTQCSTRIGRS
jgi:signal transduction histidine kinase